MSQSNQFPSIVGATFDDEFLSFTSSGNGSVGWMTSYPFSGIASRWLYPNKEVAYFADAGTQYDPFSLSDGVLTITANAVPASSNPVSLPFISGVITTKKMFAQQYGYFEARLKVPAGQGLWPAFWMLPATDTTKTTAELDVLEVLGSNPYQLFSTTHDYLATSNGTSQKLFTVSDMSADFHTYGVDWEPTSVSFYMDGYLLGSTATPSSMNSPMYLLLNLAVGGTGSWPGPALSTLTSAQYQIDYVRAYATANTINVSGSGVLSSADAANVAMPTFLTPPPGVTPGADPNSAVVSGTVQHIGQGDPGTAQAGVTVQILDINGRVLKTTVTDRTGAFSFPGRATGYYSLVFLPPRARQSARAALPIRRRARPRNSFWHQPDRSAPA